MTAPDPTLDEMLSADVDGELDPDERATVAAALERSPAARARRAELAATKARLAASPPVAVPPGALERIRAGVATAVGGDDRDAGPGAAGAGSAAPVVELGSRRRTPVAATVAAVAAAVVLVVGGLGGDPSIVPAVGDLVARHSAAAAEVAPADPMDDMDDVPPPADSMEMVAASEDAGLAHLVYRDIGGGVVSVFREAGEARLDSLEGGEMAMIDDMPAWRGEADGMEVTVLDGDGYVWTVVAEPDHEAMMSVMADDLPTRDRGWGERLRDTADVLVGPWG